MVQDIRDSAGGWPVRQTQVEIDRILIKAKLRRRRMEPEATDGQSDYAKYQRYTTTIEKEKYRAGQKRHHEEAEQLDEGSPKRKAPCIREPLTELPVPKEESRPISPLIPNFPLEHFVTQPGSRTGENGEWDEAQRPNLENLVMNEHETSRRYSDADLEHVWSREEEYLPHNLPNWANYDSVLQEIKYNQLTELSNQLRNQLNRPRVELEELLGRPLDTADGIESSSMQGMDLEVAKFHRPSKRVKRTGELNIVGNSSLRAMLNVPSNLSSQLQLKEPSTKLGCDFKIWEDSNVGTDEESPVPSGLPNQQGRESYAMQSRVLQSLSYMDLAQSHSPALLTGQSSNMEAGPVAEFQSTSNVDLNTAAQRKPFEQSADASNDVDRCNNIDAEQSESNRHSNIPVLCERLEQSTESSNNVDAMDGIESQLMSIINGDTTHHNQPSDKLPSKKNPKGKRGGKGALRKKGSKTASMKHPTNITAGAPSVKKTKAKKEKDVTPPWLHLLLEQPRQTRSRDSKILWELDAQCQIVPARKSQRSGRS